MSAFVFALLLWMLGQGPAPAPHRVMVSPAASTPAVRAPVAADSGRLHYRPGTLSLPSPSGEVLPPPPAAPTVAAGPGTYVNPGQWLDGPDPGDVAAQLPEETTGRAYG